MLTSTQFDRLIKRLHSLHNSSFPGDIMILDGIKYYQVGRNSTHSFYYGLDKKKNLLRLSVDEESFDSDDMKVTTVISLNEYWGHA